MLVAIEFENTKCKKNLYVITSDLKTKYEQFPFVFSDYKLLCLVILTMFRT